MSEVRLFSVRGSAVPDPAMKPLGDKDGIQGSAAFDAKDGDVCNICVGNDEKAITWPN